MNVFCNVKPRMGKITMHDSLRRIACLVTVGGMLTFKQIFVNVPIEPEARPIKKLKPTSVTDTVAMPDVWK